MRLLFSLCFITTTVFAQDNSVIIQNIKKEFLFISELQEKGTLTEEKRSYSCKDQSINGIITYHYQNQDLRLISHSFNQGHSSYSRSYYISDNILFFYLSTSSLDNDKNIYNENTGDLIGIEENWSISQLRIYFDNEKAVKCLIKQYGNKDVTEEIKQKYPDVSLYFKNKEEDCDYVEVKEIVTAYKNLIDFQDHNRKNTCLLHL